MSIGLFSGLAGIGLGLLGAAVGTYYAITKTYGPLEKKFMVKSSVGVWLAILLFIIIVFSLPAEYRYYIWIPYVIVLPMAIVKLVKEQARLRKLEADKAHS